MIRYPSVSDAPHYDRVEQGKCLWCRAPFLKNAPNQKTCSERCRNEHRQRRDRETARRNRARRAE